MDTYEIDQIVDLADKAKPDSGHSAGSDVARGSRKTINLLLLIGSLLVTGAVMWGVLYGIKQDFMIPAPAIWSVNGACYITGLPAHSYWLFETLSDGIGHFSQARTQLFENDKPLGLAHSSHEDIRKIGLGQFSHWDSTIYFSSSDNSDPRTNGRHYRVVTTATLPTWMLAVLAPSLLMSLYLNRRIMSERRVLQIIPWQTIFSCLLVAASIGWGIWLRVLFFRSFPDPFPTPDTSSYLSGVYSLLEKGQFDLFSIRTPGFPLLIWLTLIVFKSFAALNVVHGALTLLAALAIGFVVRAFGGPWRLPAALAVGFLAIHPHLLFWEHFVMTEGSFQALFVLALGATALAILRPTPRCAALAGVLTAISVLIRPQGIFLTPLVLLALAWAGRHLGGRKLLWMLAAASVGPLLLLGGWSTRNFVVHGFFGLSNVGPVVNFGVAARWVDLESPTLAEDKALIADSIRRYRSMPDDVNWVQYAPDGPVQILDRKYVKIPNYPNCRDQILNELAREAILSHPIAFASRGLQNVYILVTDQTSQLCHDGYNFNVAISWDNKWKDLTPGFPVDQYRAALNQTRFPIHERSMIFTDDIRPALGRETSFFRGSLGATLLALLALPLLCGPRRWATALAVVSVILLILTAAFFSEPTERYLSVIHGSAALAGGLAMTGLLERWMSRRTPVVITGQRDCRPTP